MKIIEYKTKSVESFGTGYNITTEFTTLLNNGTTINGSVPGEVNDEKKFITKTKKIIATTLRDCCVAMKEIIAILGDFSIITGGEDGDPKTRNVTELDFYDIEDYESSSQIERFIVDNFTDEVENLYCEVKPLMDNPEYEDYFGEPDYFYAKGISLIEYAGLVDNGNPITPLSRKSVDLGRDDLKSAQEVLGGENYQERLTHAMEYVKGSIFGEELYLDGERVFIIQRKND